jgi:hypothetical protein
MEVKESFGFVTGCHPGDKFMVQATLASIKHFCPKVPICLVLDGTFDVSELEKDYGAIMLRVPDLPSIEMQTFIGGDYRAKLAAMWEGPFEFYVWLDSDAIVWGDFTSQICTDVDFQIFWSEISIPADTSEIPPWLPHFYFDPEKLRQFDSNFEWRGNAYFSSGAFACRRNAIPYHEWVRLEDWARQTPALFAWGEMGMLNYIVHAMRQRGELKVRMSDLQHIPGHHGMAELKRDCDGAGWYFPKVIQRPRVAHFCGRKPFLFDGKAYSRPFTIARLEHHRRRHSELVARVKVVNEDCSVLAGKMGRRLRRYITKH